MLSRGGKGDISHFNFKFGIALIYGHDRFKIDYFWLYYIKGMSLVNPNWFPTHLGTYETNIRPCHMENPMSHFRDNFENKVYFHVPNS